MDARREQGIKVAANKDRFGNERKVFGVMPFMVKVSPQDTAETSLIIEQANDYKGGPPRHLHHDQDEWFYVVEGQYKVEIAGTIYLLNPGDCILAPRKVPHCWAQIGAGTGKMLVGFFPAGKMEAFFTEASKLENLPPHTDLKQLFADHGMEITGPPLEPAR